MKILAIGTPSDIVHSKFSGQSIMFDGIVDSMRREGYHVAVIDISSHFKRRSFALRSLDYILVLFRLLWNLLMKHYEIAYITTSQSKNGFIRDYLIITLCRCFKVKVISHQFGANYNQLLNALNDKARARLTDMLNYCSTIIVEGQHMKSQYSFFDGYDKKVRIIPNGLPVVGKNAMTPKHYNASCPFKMYYLSNLIWSKGYYDVLCAVDLLVNKYKKNVECVFAGAFMEAVDDERSGISNKNDFMEYVKDHHLEKVVSYYPGMYGDEKDAAFSQSNVFLLPSYYINEGQPVSIIEAMAYGCVPIVTEYRHIPMMVTKENGCFVEPKNPEQIASAIVELMEHPDVYAAKSEASIRDYKEQFTFEVFASKVMACIKESI